MTAWQPDRDDPHYETAQDSLGGLRRHELTPDEKAALARAGMASPAEVARQASTDAIRRAAGLSGVAVDSAERTTGIEGVRRAARVAGVLAAMDEGATPTEIAALFRARDKTAGRISTLDHQVEGKPL